jgi:hypothetical protein
MTSKATSALFDVNVWLALSHRAHPHHDVALELRPGLPPGAFCRITQIALLRLLTREQVMGPDTQTAVQAWKTYRRFVEDDGAAFLAEPEGIQESWRELCGLHEIRSANSWSDAYLAAFALCAGMQFVTFDRGFRRFHGLHCRIL